MPCKFSVSDVTDTESQNTVLNRTCVNASAEFKVTIIFSTDTEALGGHGTDTALICVNRPLLVIFATNEDLSRLTHSHTSGSVPCFDSQCQLRH